MTRFAEMRKRLWFLLGALVVYRVGTFIPVPGIDAARFAAFFSRSRARSSACSTCSRAARCSASAFSP
jgi:preprotein translocase subunit SecY